MQAVGGRLIDIEKASDDARDIAAPKSEDQYIEELLNDGGDDAVLKTPSSTVVPQPEPVYLGGIHLALIHTCGHQNGPIRQTEKNNILTGLPAAYHQNCRINTTMTKASGGSRLLDQASRCLNHRSTSIEHHISSKKYLDELTSAHPLLKPPAERPWESTISYYMRLCATIIFINTIAIMIKITLLAKKSNDFAYGHAATAAGANLFVSALFRHEHCINILFRLACALPLRAPLWLRRRLAKIYSYGGIHSGCGISALLWYICYAILAARQFEGTYAAKIALAATSASTLMLLTLIIVFSHPQIRRCHHNSWEIIHRLGGYTAIAFVGAQILIVAITTAHQTSYSITWSLATTPTFYFLVLTALILIYPWLRLRRREITNIEPLSSHAIRLHFSDRTLPPCKGYRLATNPLLENHGFATIPNPQQSNKGYSILVSNAGDWTSNLIAHPPRRIWTRGAPTTGVMRIATLFSPLVIVATGSGIGPCLSFLQPRPDWPVRIIWSCRSPETTYGAEIVRAVLKADQHAVIVDTKETGHPDLPALAWSVRERSAAEAVVVISNPKVTGMVVGGLERRGIAAFGAIFDS